MNGLDAMLLGKLEFFNPTDSVKDRVAIAMIDDAQTRGILKRQAHTKFKALARALFQKY